MHQVMINIDVSWITETILEFIFIFLSVVIAYYYNKIRKIVIIYNNFQSLWTNFEIVESSLNEILKYYDLNKITDKGRGLLSVNNSIVDNINKTRIYHLNKERKTNMENDFHNIGLELRREVLNNKNWYLRLPNNLGYKVINPSIKYIEELNYIKSNFSPPPLVVILIDKLCEFNNYNYNNLVKEIKSYKKSKNVIKKINTFDVIKEDIKIRRIKPLIKYTFIGLIITIPISIFLSIYLHNLIILW